MTADLIRAGERFAVDDRMLEVVTYRIAGTRQIISARDIRQDGAALTTVVIDLARPDADGLVVGPVDPAVARALALEVLGGHRQRLPVATEANILAAAVVALTGGAA
ncbi:MAG: hypothetical protein M0006_03450 [Magnetospirillum sp.]|nr:hypothetical protein [Magnetospirillum sp.]